MIRPLGLLTAALSGCVAAETTAPDKALLGIEGLNGIAVRPQAAVGWAVAADDGFRSAASMLAGTRLLLSPNGSTWIGGELDWQGRDNALGGSLPRNALLGGLVVEQQVARHFHLAVGSLAMVGIDRHSQNGPDLMYEIGWRPAHLLGRAMPMLTYRCDYLLTSPVVSTSSLAVGLGWSW